MHIKARLDKVVKCFKMHFYLHYLCILIPLWLRNPGYDQRKQGRNLPMIHYVSWQALLPNTI